MLALLPLCAGVGCGVHTPGNKLHTVLHSRVEGRRIVEAPLADAAARDTTSVRIAYSLSRLSARFRGPEVAIELEDHGHDPKVAGNVFAVEVDGEPHQPLTTVPGERRRYLLAHTLGGGPGAVHTVRLTKRTEAAVGEVRFHGFVAPGGLLTPPLPSTRRLWLLGDSITCGYGSVGRGPHCPFTPQTEDAVLAYGGRLAYALGASVEAVAYSGRGLWQNRDNSRRDTVAQLFERVLPNDALVIARSGLAPHAIVVNLGTNDAYAEAPLDRPAFTAAWVALLERLRVLAPKAPIFLALGPMLTNTWDAHPMALRHVAWSINDAIAARAAAGDRRVTLIGLKVQDGKLGYGCDYHPSLATHAQMAQHVADTLAEALQWTQNPRLGRPSQLL